MFAAIWHRRMVRKGPDPRLGKQEPAVGPLDLQSEAVGAKRQVYLVIFHILEAAVASLRRRL